LLLLTAAGDRRGLFTGPGSELKTMSPVRVFKQRGLKP
jgi:hypothetical protein